LQQADINADKDDMGSWKKSPVFVSFQNNNSR
jgi:hypothetical protein